MPALLRPASLADAATITRIWHESASLPGVGPAIMPSPAELHQRVLAGFAQGWQVTLASAKAGPAPEVAGFMALLPAEAKLAELFLLPSARGTGLGAALLDHAKTALPAGFTLYTSASNGPARRFYERAGLRLLREDSHPRDGRPIVHYRWQP